MDYMKRFILLLVVFCVVGCNTKPSPEGSVSPNEEALKKQSLLNQSETERLLKEAVHVDDVDELLKNAVVGAELKDSDDLACHINQSKPYSGLIKGMNKLGQLQFLGWVTAGKANGFTTHWHQSGQKKSEGTLKNGKKDGPWIYWSKNGKKVTEEIWKEGKQHGSVTQWFESGQKMAEGHATNGKLHGLATGWFENGQKRSEQLYENGQVVSAKMWNSKGEEIKTYEESKK